MSLAASAALVAAPGIVKAVQAADVSSSHPADVTARVAADRSLLAGAERIVLAFGSRGPLVAAAQQRLNEVLPDTHLAVDGIFGPLTHAAVIDFQKRYGLTPTGEIDALTWATLFKAPVLLLAPPAGSQLPSTYQPGAVPYPTSYGAGSTPASMQTAGTGIGAQTNPSSASGVGGSGYSVGVSTPETNVGGGTPPGGGSGVGAVSPAGNGQSAPPPSNGGTPVGNRGATGRPPSGTSPVTVVSPGNPSTGPSTYVLSNGVALPLPRQYLVNGSVDQGVDYSAPGGTPLYAMGDGIIIGEGIGGFGPNAPVLEITSGPLSGLEIYYGHAGPDLVRVGQRVKAGQQISEVGYGIVGISTGPHLEIGFYPPGPLGAGSRMLSVINSLLAKHPGAGASAATVSSVASSAVSSQPRSSTGLGGAAVRATVIERPDPSPDPSPGTSYRAPAPSAAGGVVQSSRLKATTTAQASAVAQPTSRVDSPSASAAVVRQGAAPSTQVAASGETPVAGAASGSPVAQYQPQSVSSQPAASSSVGSAPAATTVVDAVPAEASTTAAVSSAPASTQASAVTAEPSTTAAVSSAPTSTQASAVAAEPSTTPAVSTPAGAVAGEPSTTPTTSASSTPTPSASAPSTPAGVVASTPVAAPSQGPAEAGPATGAADTAAGPAPGSAIAGAGQVIAQPAVVTSAVSQGQAEVGRGGPPVTATQQWSNAGQVGVAAAQPTSLWPGAHTGVVAVRAMAGMSRRQSLHTWAGGWRRGGWR